MSACSSTPVTPPPAPAPMKAAAALAPTAPAAAPRPMVPSSTIATVTLPAYLDPKNSISTERNVYFDFDEFTVKQDYTALVERHGKFLASNPRVSIKIEGIPTSVAGRNTTWPLDSSGQKHFFAL